MCERFVNVAARSCAAPAQSAPVPHEPPWDALANSFASLSAAFAWGAILLALIAIVAAVGWGFLVRHWAEREARVEADECVKRLMDKWLVDEAPQIVRKHVELLQNTSLGNDDEETAADEIGKEAG
jgi:hypothetical protein